MTKFNRGNIRNARLTPEQVLEIRTLYAEGWSQGRLARQFGVSVGQIGKIVRGEAWQHYPMVESDGEVENRMAMEGTMVAPSAGSVSTSQPIDPEVIRQSQERLIGLLEKQKSREPPLDDGAKAKAKDYGAVLDDEETPGTSGTPG